jgi:FSR family fosmidomycin resistance protein-like MFS transporter
MTGTSAIHRALLRLLAASADLAAIFLAIEFLDELVYGLLGAAWPLIRNDLGLTYAQIGLLVGFPLILGNVIEPALGLLGDLGRRKRIVLAGGLCFALALTLIGCSNSFLFLLIAVVLLSPSSGAFVSLSQATLVDLASDRRELPMARWTLAGSLGALAGPALFILVAAIGGSWRIPIFFFAAVAVALALGLRFHRFPSPVEAKKTPALREILSDFLSAIRRKEILRWLLLLALGDLMLDVLLGFLALYGTDVAAVSAATAGMMVAVWTGTGVLGDALLIPLLKRMDSLKYLRFSAVLMAAVYAGFLLSPWILMKIFLLALMGLWKAGWYAIPQARLYTALPGRSGTAMAIASAFGVAAGVIPILLGTAAQRFGLGASMWLLMAGPLGLLIFLPHDAVRLQAHAG